MTKSIAFILFLVSFLFSGCHKPNDPEPVDLVPEGYSLMWSDEFNYTGLPDESKWSYDVGGSGWGNNEDQFYTNARLKNSEVKDGYLHLKAIKEDYEGKKYTSARLVTRTKGDWLYGRIEVSAKLPEGRGMWPAIWMLPTDWEYGGWPDSGEIDIMENLGYLPNWIVATFQTQAYTYIQLTHKSQMINIPDCYSEFHTYILEWEPNECRVYVDSKLYNTFKNNGAGFETWPFDKRFHLILNVAVGGTFGGAQGIDDSIFPQSMVVDYVRVYQKK